MKAAIHAIGAFSYAFSQWLVLFIITKLLGIESAGYYALYLGLLTPMAIFLNYGLRNYIAADTGYSINDSSYYILRYLGVFTFLFLAVVFSFFVERPLVFVIVCVMKCFDSLAELEYGAWNRRKLVRHYAYSQFIRLALFSLLFTLFYFFLDVGDLSVVAFPFAIVITYMLHDKPFSSLKPLVRVQVCHDLLKLFRDSMPLAFSALLVASNVGVNRYIISNQLNEVALANYIFLYYYFTVAGIVVLSASQVSIPYLSERKNRDQTSLFKKINKLLFGYSVLFCLFILVFSQPLNNLLYSADYEYSLGAKLLMGIGSSFAFFSIFLNAVLIAKKQLPSLLKINIYSFLFNTFATWSLVSFIGLDGAFFSFLLVNFILLILYVFMFAKLKEGTSV